MNSAYAPCSPKPGTRQPIRTWGELHEDEQRPLIRLRLDGIRFGRTDRWPDLPAHNACWLAVQREVSRLPEPDRLLVESFPQDGRQHLCVYGFAGRNAQQTLGLLVTKQMEAQGLAPLGFVATDYATLIWGLDPVTDPAPLFDPSRLRDGLEGWLRENMKGQKGNLLVHTKAVVTDFTTDGLVQGLRGIRVFQGHFGHVLQRDSCPLWKAQGRCRTGNRKRIVWIDPDHGTNAVRGKLTERHLHGDDVGYLISPALVQ